MSAIAKETKQIRPIKLVGVSSILCGLPWAVFCVLMLFIVSGEVLVDGFQSSVDQLLVNILI